MDCTEEGMKSHQDHILQVVFAYMKMLQREGPQVAQWEELAVQMDNSFRFQETPNPFSFVSSAASKLRQFEPAHVLSGDKLLRKYDGDLIASLVDILAKPELAQVIMAHSSFEGELRETWYKTEYAIHPFTREQEELWKQDSFPLLHLPAPNEFLPSQFDLLPLQGIAKNEHHQSRPPKLLSHSPALQLWFKQDSKFKLPRVYLQCVVRSPVAYASAMDSIYAQLFVDVLKDSLNEYAYAADISGLSYAVSNTITGIQVSIEGFHHKLPALTLKVVQAMSKPDIPQDMFDRHQERLEHKFANFAQEQPHQLAIYATNYLLNVPRVHVEDKLNLIKHVTLDGMFGVVCL